MGGKLRAPGDLRSANSTATSLMFNAEGAEE